MAARAFDSNPQEAACGWNIAHLLDGFADGLAFLGIKV